MSSEYCILKFSPSPEFLDPVNVALLIDDGRLRVHSDPSFPRLKSVAPRFEPKHLDFLIQALLEDLRGYNLLEAIETIPKKNVQFEVSGIKRLEQPISQFEIGILCQNYLKRLSAGRRIPTEGRDRYIDTELGGYLDCTVHVPPGNLLKRASPKDFLSGRSYGLLRTNGHRISRVIQGAKGIVLVDALNLQAQSANLIAKRADSVAFAYYRVGAVKKQIESIEGRFLKRASVLFGAKKLSQDPHYAYYWDKLRRESDVSAESDSADDAKQLREVMEEAVAL